MLLINMGRHVNIRNYSVSIKNTLEIPKRTYALLSKGRWDTFYAAYSQKGHSHKQIVAIGKSYFEQGSPGMEHFLEAMKIRLKKEKQKNKKNTGQTELTNADKTSIVKNLVKYYFREKGTIPENAVRRVRDTLGRESNYSRNKFFKEFVSNSKLKNESAVLAYLREEFRGASRLIE